MRRFVIYVFVLCLSLWHGKRYTVNTVGPPYLNLDEELSTSVLLALENSSFVKTKLTYKDHLDLKRRYDSQARRNSTSELIPPRRRYLKPKYEFDLRGYHFRDPNSRFNASYQKTMERLCYILGNTYKAAVLDLENYYPLRFFYRNVRDFEIGYLSHDIVQTYSNILELYHMMVWQYEMQNFTYFAPPSYMFFIYTHMALLGKHLIHQCNMMGEIENKYKEVISLFNDSTTTPQPESPELKKNVETLDSVRYMKNITVEKFKDRQRDRREKINELFKKPKRTAIDNYLAGKRKRKPFKSKWPLRYGWSIEENWQGYSYWSGIFNYSDEEEEHHDKFL